MGLSRPLFLYFRIFYKQLTVNMFIKSCRWSDSNPAPLVSEATALSTAPQPLICCNLYLAKCSLYFGQIRLAAGHTTYSSSSCSSISFVPSPNLFFISRIVPSHFVTSLVSLNFTFFFVVSDNNDDDDNFIFSYKKRKQGDRDRIGQIRVTELLRGPRLGCLVNTCFLLYVNDHFT